MSPRGLTVADRNAWRDRHRRTPLTFTLDGVVYEVPEHPARLWVLAALSDEPADVLLDALPDPVAADLWDATMDPGSGITPELLSRIGNAVLGRVAGRPWWQVTQLIATLVAGWEELHGRAADRGLGDPLDWPLDRLCDWVYFRQVDGADEQVRARIDRSLAEPVGAPAAAVAGGEAPWEDEASGWLQLAGVQAAGGPAAVQP